MSTETDLKPVKYVRDLEPGEVFNPGTDNRLYVTDSGDFIASSWCPASPEEGYAQGETAVWEAEENGYPTDIRICMGMAGDAALIPGDSPQHDEALAKFGYKVVTE